MEEDKSQARKWLLAAHGSGKLSTRKEVCSQPGARIGAIHARIRRSMRILLLVCRCWRRGCYPPPTKGQTLAKIAKDLKKKLEAKPAHERNPEMDKNTQAILKLLKA